MVRKRCKSPYTRDHRLEASCLKRLVGSDNALDLPFIDRTSSLSLFAEMDGLMDTSGIDGELGRRSVTDHPKDVRNRSR